MDRCRWRGKSPSPARGSRGGETPLVGFSADTLTASNRRTVGHSGESGFHRGTKAPWSVGAGRAKSPCEWSTGDTVGWRGEAQCRASANGQRDATGERSVSLAKFAGITPHNLRSALIDHVFHKAGSMEIHMAAQCEALRLGHTMLKCLHVTG